MRPFISITDFFLRSQVRMMLEIFNLYKHPLSERDLAVGVMISRKTLLGLPTKWIAAFPKKERISKILFYEEAYNCLHYADYGKDPDLAKHLTLALSYAGQNLDALQLDMVLPNPDDVKRAVEKSKLNLEVILQINDPTFEIIKEQPTLLISRLREYDGVISRVLLDKSMGKGKILNPDFLRPFIDEIYGHLPSTEIIVGGGLGPYTMDILEGLVQNYPLLSWDAQSRLRPSKDALDPLNWYMCAEYIKKSLKLDSTLYPAV
jgi:hypothetical protein